MKCSIVIRAYNEEKHLGRLLDGILQQSVRDVEIILVDSGSTDKTLDVARRYPVEIVHICPEEFTFGRSLNLGIQAAHADRIVIASAHVYPVYPDWLEHLLAPLGDPKTALSYGKQRGNFQSKFSEHQIFAHWFPDASVRRQTHPFCNNANAAIRRSLWEIHAYDETLPALEDLEWANWAMGQGFCLSYVAEAEIIHVHNETPPGIYNRYRREAMAFKRIFPHEHFHWWDFVRLFTSNTSADLGSALQQGRFRRSAWNVVWFRFMQFWGTYQGFRQSGPLTWPLRQTFYYPLSVSKPASSRRQDALPIQYKDHIEG